MIIRKATAADTAGVWEIFREVIQAGDTYVFDPATPQEDLQKHWFAPYMYTYVAEEGGHIIGTYILKPNQIDLGAHIANGSYMVHAGFRGRGVGEALCLHSLQEARQLGFRAMQFNIVVSTNTQAVKLWQKMGFSIIGTVPEAFQHQELGLVDAHIMYRKL
ncbi:N-acetyltransferase family protein [Pontibacter sp. 13R65]|uniref:GNAT family N-acetyltransferase n=1 Tax=Pontibacter sp. 13R65 TaxID=3127458 RepID=UPI00301E31C4